MSSPESLAGDHASSEIARGGQLWGPAAVTETTGRQLPSEASPSGGGRETKTRRELSQGPLAAAKMLPVDGLLAAGRRGGPAIQARPESEPRPRQGCCCPPSQGLLSHCAQEPSFQPGRPLPWVQRPQAPVAGVVTAAGLEGSYSVECAELWALGDS